MLVMDKVCKSTGIIDDGKEEIKVLFADVTLDRIRIIINSNVEMEDAKHSSLTPMDIYIKSQKRRTCRNIN